VFLNRNSGVQVPLSSPFTNDLIKEFDKDGIDNTGDSSGKSFYVLEFCINAGDIMNLRIVFICILLLTTFSGLASAATLEVGPGQKYLTIQSAVDAANMGDVVSVNDGVYSENVFVKKSGITIIGKNKEKAIIDGKKASSGILIDQVNNVTVSGLTIQNSGASGKSDAGVTIYSARDNIVANMILINNIAGVSVYAESNNNVISGNEIKSNINQGIFVYSSGNNKIYNNNIEENKIGIYVDQSKNNMIYANNFIGNSNEQGYDNGGQNSWDDGKSGNYWNDHKTGGGYIISGAPKAKDNFPLSSPVAIRFESPPGKMTTKNETGKSTPGFEGFAVVALFVAAAVLIRMGKQKA
jgi:parallel beta-helix repeat protein